MTRDFIVSRTVIAAILGLALALPGSAAAQITVSTVVPAAETGADLPRGEGGVPLALDDAIALALQHNLALIVERHNTVAAELQESGSRGIYDLTGTVHLSRFDETSPSASNLDGADITTFEGSNWNLGLSQLVPSGGTFSVDWTNARSESNSLFATLNPSFRVDFDFGFTQPLLRGRGRPVTERNIRIARTDREVSHTVFEGQVMTTIQSVEAAYWTLVEAIDQLAVAEESLALAEQLHEQNTVRVEVGTLAPLELVQSEAGIAIRREEIIRARAAVGDAEDRLRQLLGVRQGGLWELPIRPITDPEREPVEVDVAASIETALERRPEILARRLRVADLRADAAFFRNQRLPQLDLSVTYGFNGLGGDITERDFFTSEILFMAPGDYSDALDQVTGGDFEGWAVALNLAYPFRNRAGEAASATAEVAFDRGAADLEALEMQIATEIRRLARALGSAQEQIASAGVSRRLAERNLDAEQKRYENGLSTSYQVLEIQEDLSAARSREVAAVTGFRRALTLFRQAEGTLIEARGVELVGAE